MNIIQQNLAKKIQEGFIFSGREHAELLSIVESWHSDSIAQQHKRMGALLSHAKPSSSKTDSRGEYKTSEILSLIPSDLQVKSLLDLGAGSGDIVTALKKKLNLKRDNVYALTLDPLPLSTEFSPAFYDENMKILLPDKSIDLIIITQVLHHIHPEDRKGTLQEVQRVLSPEGVVIIQEHDFRGELETYISLDILHTFWYVKNKEKVDGLYLMSIPETQLLFSKIGMKQEKITEVRGWQRMYWASYIFGEMTLPDSSETLKEYLASEKYTILKREQNKISSSLQEFDPISLYLSYMSKTLAYHPRHVRELGSQAVKWGQLKIFLSVVQALLDFWDTTLVPKLTVVYAGAYPGWSFPMLASMFPSVTWHLYDPKFEKTYTSGRLTYRKQYFEDVDARKWSQDDNIFFFSDIRRYGIDKLSGEKLELSVAEDMASQARWVKLMNPYQASLKLRAPYYLDKIPPEVASYLEGNIMLQSFNSPSSAEARLIPIRSEKTGLFYDNLFDWKRYESELFYHNAVTREKSLYFYSGPIDDSTGLDNHYDSIHLLTVLDEYKKVYAVGRDLIAEVMNSISNPKSKKKSTLASKREADKRRIQLA